VVVGSFVAPRAERAIGRSTLFASVLLMAVALVVPAVTNDPAPIMASMVVSGLVIMVWNIVTVTLRQRIVPDQLLGRVNAGYRFFAWGTMPIGVLLGGLVAEALGMRAVFVLGGAMTLALLGFRLVLDDRTIDAAERHPATAATA